MDYQEISTLVRAHGWNIGGKQAADGIGVTIVARRSKLWPVPSDLSIWEYTEEVDLGKMLHGEVAVTAEQVLEQLNDESLRTYTILLRPKGIVKGPEVKIEGCFN